MSTACAPDLDPRVRGTRTLHNYAADHDPRGSTAPHPEGTHPTPDDEREQDRQALAEQVDDGQQRGDAGLLRDIRARAFLKGDTADAYLELDDAMNAAMRDLGIAKFRLEIGVPEPPELNAAVGRWNDTYVKHRDLVSAAAEMRGQIGDVATHRAEVEKATAHFVAVAGASLTK